MRACHLPWDYLNPYQSQLAGELNQCGIEVSRGGRSTWILRYLFSIRRGEVVHFHWIDPYFDRPSVVKSLVKAVFFVFQVHLLKWFGRKIIFTLHNLDSHEHRHPRLERWVVTQVAGLSDGILAHCGYARRAVIKRYNLAPEKVHVVPHGNYIQSYPNQVSKPKAREKLGLSDEHDVLLFLGSLKRYKGVDDLIEAVRGIDNPNLRLVIAGKLQNDEERDYILQQSEIDHRISIHEGFVEGEDIQYYLNASDIVVLPYTKVLTSGSMILAMSFARPVIVPRVGCLTEAGSFGGAYFIDSEKESVASLRDSIRQAIADKDAAAAAGEQGYQQIEKWDWSKIARLTSAIYKAA